MTNAKFGKQLSLMLTHKNRSKRAVARGAGTKDAGIRRLRSGMVSQPTLETVIQLGIGLGCTVFDADWIQLLGAAGYKLSDLSPYQRSFAENWPKGEGLRVTVETMHMLTSLLSLLAADLVSAAPTELRPASQGVNTLLDALSSEMNALVRKHEQFQKAAKPYAGKRKARKKKLDETS